VKYFLVNFTEKARAHL